MKLLIASDIHGSSYWCRKLTERITAEAPDMIVLLGDILYHGPRNDLPREYDPKQVIDMLNPLAQKLICVRGNCDSEVDQMVLDFSVLTESTVICDGNTVLAAVHGHHIAEAKRTPTVGSAVLYGHTHVPGVFDAPECDKSERKYINPGSVSIPKESSPNSYMTYENGAFEWKRVEDGSIYNTYTL